MIRKKFLALAFTILPFIALAENNFYVKGGMGLNRINNTKFSNHNFEGKINVADTFPLLQIGIGRHLNDSIRAEIVFDYYFLFKVNEQSTNPNKDIFKISSKTKAEALMLNVYKDVFATGKITHFVGGGIGVANFKESASGFVVAQEDNIHYDLNSVKSKRLHWLAYKLTLGSAIKLNNNTVAEISYNYYHLGSNKPKTIGGIKNIGNRAYEIHNITFGIRKNI